MGTPDYPYHRSIYIDNVNIAYVSLIMKIEWDEKKNRANIKKHGVSFKEASEIFDYPLVASSLDKRYDYHDERWVSFGTAKNGKVIAVGHLYWLSENDGEEHIRIITARKATKKEREQYEKG